MTERAQALWRHLSYYFHGDVPSFWVALVPLLILSAVLFTRHLGTNCIFDEQEALLANPYVNGKTLPFKDAIHRDFWGLPPDRSVGSYRPLPNYVWRSVWVGQQFLTNKFNATMDALHLSAAPRPVLEMNPWIFHWINVLIHAMNGALVVWLVYTLTKRKGTAWIAGAVFVASAVITEAVCGVVGIADVMGGLGAILALLALRFPMWAMPGLVFGSVLVGLFSKESALVCVPLIPFAALVWAPMTHPKRPMRWARAALALVSSALALVVYVELRKKWFPTPLPQELLTPLAPNATLLQRASRGFFVWFHQASLPHDPLNNPLVEADMPHRISGALRVFWRGLWQVMLPTTLSGDYSYPQEPIPTKLFGLESVLGGLAMLGLPVAGLVLWIQSWRKEQTLRKSLPLTAQSSALETDAFTSKLPHLAMLASVGLVWIVGSYFPHSNIPVLLPTVRAERFWYFPIVGSCLAIAAGFAWLYHRTQAKHYGALAVALCSFFLLFQSLRARSHAFDYQDDLVFWDATRHSVPNSAKAHLNYSVMWGARGRLDIRLQANTVALHLAPKWPMAHIYQGDTLCRLHRAQEAWPHYYNGFELAPGDPNLISLSLQCLWDEGALEPHRAELLQLAEKNPGSWLAYLVHDTLNNGEQHKGVDPKYRPRGYNEGPKE